MHAMIQVHTSGANIEISIDKQAAHAVAAAVITACASDTTITHHPSPSPSLHSTLPLLLFRSVLIRNSCELIYNVEASWKILDSACDQFKSAAIPFMFMFYKWIYTIQPPPIGCFSPATATAIAAAATIVEKIHF